MKVSLEDITIFVLHSTAPPRKEGLHVSFEDEVDTAEVAEAKRRKPPSGKKYVLRAPLYGPDGDDDSDASSGDVVVYGSRSSTFTVVESEDRFTVFWRTIAEMWKSKYTN